MVDKADKNYQGNISIKNILWKEIHIVASIVGRSVSSSWILFLRKKFLNIEKEIP